MSRRTWFNVILFDIDNVLVDTRSSYLAAIQKTVELYLGRSGVVTPREVDQFKLLGGFNDDWDACYGIITFLETALQGKPIRFGDHRLHRLSIAEVRNIFPERPLGIEGLRRNLRRLYERVKTPSYRKIAQIFQRVYLGSRKKPGLIRMEKPIFPKSLLKKLRERGVRLGIVTGRDRTEAEFALRRFGILEFFEVLVTIDQVRREEKRTGRSLRKPNPWPILEAAKRFRGQSPFGGHPFLPVPFKGTVPFRCFRCFRFSRRLRFLYVGDLPDDVLAGNRAKKFLSMKTVAFPRFSRDLRAVKEELRKIKPDYLLKNPQGILRLLN